MVQVAAKTYGLPVKLIAACGKAESNWYRKAQRWGTKTTEAIIAINNMDYEGLQKIVAEVQPDISFGYGQRIVLYHYYGDRTHTVSNCLDVRKHVWDNPTIDIMQMAIHLRNDYERARYADLSPVQGDILLMTLCTYNAGHPPPPTSLYWSQHIGNIQNYRSALEWAQKIEGS